MLEVTVRLKFNQVCPGDVKRPDGKNFILAMRRDPEGRVMFLPTWWAGITRYAAKVLNRHQASVKKIRWDPVVDGNPRRWRRYLPLPSNKPDARPRYAIHEAFMPGETIGVNCVLPSDIAMDDLWQLLDIAGTYKGISSYKPDEGYGTFKVEEIRKRKRTVDAQPNKENADNEVDVSELSTKK